MLSGHMSAHACTRNARVSAGHSVLYPQSFSLEPLELLILHLHLSLLSQSTSLLVISSLFLPPSIRHRHSFIESDHLIPVSHVPLFLSFDKIHFQLVCPWAIFLYVLFLCSVVILFVCITKIFQLLLFKTFSVLLHLTAS